MADDVRKDAEQHDADEHVGNDIDAMTAPLDGVWVGVADVVKCVFGV
jgi:hypothetical protein